MRLNLGIAAIGVAASVSATAAPSLSCLVTAVADGDTLTAMCGERAESIKVRLSEIDAPESKQPFGIVSRAHLATICLWRSAEVRPEKVDKYRRTVARVICGGTDANASQVAAGLAWAYTQYLTDPEIKALEQSARASKSGLWVDSNPMPPWEWRHRQ